MEEFVFPLKDGKKAEWKQDLASWQNTRIIEASLSDRGFYVSVIRCHTGFKQGVTLLLLSIWTHMQLENTLQKKKKGKHSSYGSP